MGLTGNHRKTLRLGTRRSLLARSQSAWVAHQLEKHHPQLQVELVGIETRGDRLLEVPLSQVEGKEFFVAELDQALRSGEVDFCVHSFKDLSLSRPSEFCLAALPPRENPRDVIVFSPQAMDMLRAGESLRIGTSSPRRLENIPRFLANALPRFKDGAPRLEFVEIRGNVNTRLHRLRAKPGSERYLDGVVLALAGLIRLWDSPEGRQELRELLYSRSLGSVRWMILPLKECPAAPGQGVLAVECRESDRETVQLLSVLDDKENSHLVLKERGLLAEWGGGCHQRIGATALHNEFFEELIYIRGVKPNGEYQERTQWSPQPIFSASQSTSARSPWDGMAWRKSREEAFQKWIWKDQDQEFFLQSPASFITHSRALPESWTRSDLQGGPRIWTSGVSSWFRLAQQGIWVEGCAEGFGFESLLPTLCQPVLGLPPISEWCVLTHEAGRSVWKNCKVLSTYALSFDKSLSQVQHEVSAATHFFWSSSSQFQAFGHFANAKAHHACGPGRTYQYLKAQGLDISLFPSVEEWREWNSMPR